MGGVGGGRQRDHFHGMEESLEMNSLYEKNLIHNTASIIYQPRREWGNQKWSWGGGGWGGGRGRAAPGGPGGAGVS